MSSTGADASQPRRATAEPAPRRTVPTAAHAAAPGATPTRPPTLRAAGRIPAHEFAGRVVGEPTESTRPSRDSERSKAWGHARPSARKPASSRISAKRAKHLGAQTVAAVEYRRWTARRGGCAHARPPARRHAPRPLPPPVPANAPRAPASPRAKPVRACPRWPRIAPQASRLRRAEPSARRAR